MVSENIRCELKRVKTPFMSYYCRTKNLFRHKEKPHPSCSLRWGRALAGNAHIQGVNIIPPAQSSFKHQIDRAGRQMRRPALSAREYMLNEEAPIASTYGVQFLGDYVLNKHMPATFLGRGNLNLSRAGCTARSLARRRAPAGRPFCRRPCLCRGRSPARPGRSPYPAQTVPG